MTPAKNNRMSLFGMSFLIREIMTMVVVRLSSTEERKKETQPTIHNKVLGLRVLILSVINRKPWCESTSSTMVMAPKRKKRICAISLRCSPSWVLTNPW